MGLVVDITPPDFETRVAILKNLADEISMKIDFEEEPPMFKITDTHFAKTWLLDPRAPKAEPPKAIRNLHERLLEITDERGDYHG